MTSLHPLLDAHLKSAGLSPEGPPPVGGQWPAFLAAVSGSLTTLDSSLTAVDAQIDARLRTVEEREAEQAALRRVATVIASQAPSAIVFDLIAEELTRLLGIATTRVFQFNRDETFAELVGWWSAEDAGMQPDPAVRRIGLDDGLATARAFRTGDIAHVDDYDLVPGSLAARVRALGLRSGAAAPIWVGGTAWGAVAVSSTAPGPFAAVCDRLLVQFAELAALAISGADARAELVTRAATDALTGLANRREFDERLRAQAARARATGGTVSLALFDVDHFKRINDTFGHDIGDGVLVEIAVRLGAAARGGDLIARTGGEEFAWLLPGLDGHAAWSVADRARRSMAAEPIAVVGCVTISAGVCDLAAAGSVGELVRLADSALYRAKAAGRNVTVSHGERDVRDDRESLRLG